MNINLTTSVVNTRNRILFYIQSNIKKFKLTLTQHSFKNIRRFFFATFLLLVSAAGPLFANDYWQSVDSVKCKRYERSHGGSGDVTSFGFACGSRIESGLEDIFQCYAPDEKGVCRPTSRFASRSRLPAVGAPETLDKDIGCYRYKDEAYIVVETSIPEQVEDTIFHYGSPEKCYRYINGCEKAQISPDSVAQWAKTFYSCANTETTVEGCHFSKNGLALVYDEKGEMKIWNLEGLRLYFDMKSITSPTEFLEKAERENSRVAKYTQILPYDFEEEPTDSLANASVARAKGMQVFSALKKVDRISAKFATMQDAIKACKEWKAKGAK